MSHDWEDERAVVQAGRAGRRVVASAVVRRLRLSFACGLASLKRTTSRSCLAGLNPLEAERPVVWWRFFFQNSSSPSFLLHISLSFSFSLSHLSTSPASLSSPPTGGLAEGNFRFLSPLVFVYFVAFLSFFGRTSIRIFGGVLG